MYLNWIVLNLKEGISDSSISSTVNGPVVRVVPVEGTVSCIYKIIIWKALSILYSDCQIHLAHLQNKAVLQKIM